MDPKLHNINDSNITKDGDNNDSTSTNSTNKQDIGHKYLSDTAYRELVKSMNDFTKETLGDNDLSNSDICSNIRSTVGDNSFNFNPISPSIVPKATILSTPSDNSHRLHQIEPLLIPHCDSEYIPNTQTFTPTLNDDIMQNHYYGHTMYNKNPYGSQFMYYKPSDKIQYMKTIIPLYDEYLKGYRGGMNYPVHFDPNSYYRNITPTMPEGELNRIDETMLSRIKNENERILYNKMLTKRTQNRFKGESITDSNANIKGISKTGTQSAGRPKLNRNHYSCANCSVKTTPQWRYVHGIAVCNACYMRIRKDKLRSTQGNNKNKKKLI